MFDIFFIDHEIGGIDCLVKLNNCNKDAYNSSSLVEIVDNISNWATTECKHFMLFIYYLLLVIY